MFVAPFPITNVARHANDPIAVQQEACRPRADPDIDSDILRLLAELANISFGVGQHIMHARLAMGRLGHGAEKLDPQRLEPTQGFVRVIDEQAAQRRVVAIRQGAREFRHVSEMFVGAVFDALGELLRRLGRREGTDGPGGGAAKFGIFFQQDHMGIVVRCLDGGGKAGPATADDQNVAVKIRAPGSGFAFAILLYFVDGLNRRHKTLL